MLNRTTALVVLALLLAGAGACSSGDSPPSKAKPSVSKQDRFLAAVHKADFESWADVGPADDELLDFPEEWCSELRAGHSVEHVFSDQGAALYPLGMDWGTEKSDANELLVMGVGAFCPKLRDQVTDELRESGEY